jgi:hypothetical protein
MHISVADTLIVRRYDNKSFIQRQKQIEMPKPFWGRSDEVSSCIEALKTHRLTTIVGGAGCGKSSVAQAVIATLQDRAKQNDGVYMYRDGICFVDCVPITSYERLCFMIGQTIGLIVTSTKEFGHHIRDSQMLIVLDGKSLTLYHESWALDFILAPRQGCNTSVQFFTKNLSSPRGCTRSLTPGWNPKN